MNDVGITTHFMWSLLFEGPKVFEQLAAQLFHGQIYKEQIKGVEFISSVVFAFGICSCQLNMKSKELSVSVKQAISRLKHQNKPIREITKTLRMAKPTVTFLKRKNVLESSGTPKDLEDHGKQLW